MNTVGRVVPGANRRGLGSPGRDIPDDTAHKVRKVEERTPKGEG